MEYFYAPPSNITPKSLTIDGEEFSHLTHVMRKRTGDAIGVVDGRGTAYTAIIAAIGADSARCEITGRHERLHEPERRLTLAVGMLKNASNYDFLVEKATEIGVQAIVPLRTERTIPSHARTERWRKIALSAMKQSGRCVWPDVRPPVPFSEFTNSAPTGAARFILHEKAETPLLRNVVPGLGSGVVVCIGPEGGFSEKEVADAVAAGFTAAGLGSRRLRTETAAIVAAASILL